MSTILSFLSLHFITTAITSSNLLPHQHDDQPMHQFLTSTSERFIYPIIDEITNQRMEFAKQKLIKIDIIGHCLSITSCVNCAVITPTDTPKPIKMIKSNSDAHKMQASVYKNKRIGRYGALDTHPTPEANKEKIFGHPCAMNALTRIQAPFRELSHSQTLQTPKKLKEYGMEYRFIALSVHKLQHLTIRNTQENKEIYNFIGFVSDLCESELNLNKQQATNHIKIKSIQPNIHSLLIVIIPRRCIVIALLSNVCSILIQHLN